MQPPPGGRRAAGRSQPSFSEANDVRVRVVGAGGGDAGGGGGADDEAGGGAGGGEDAADAESRPLVAAAAPPRAPGAAGAAGAAAAALHSARGLGSHSGGGMRPGRPFRSLLPAPSAAASASAAADRGRGPDRARDRDADPSYSDAGAGAEGASALAPHAEELARQDAALDRLSANLSRLGEVARDIGDEMGAQEAAIAEVRGVADRAAAAVDEATRQVEAVVRRNGAEAWVPRLVWLLALFLAAEVYYFFFL
jgi:hypothetical protein